MSVWLKWASPKRLAGLGFVLSLVPLYFVTAAVLKYGFGVGLLFAPLERFFFADPLRLRILNQVITPVLFFGGLMVAMVLNLHAVSERGRRMGDVPQAGAWNVAAALLSGLLLVVFTAYGILENFN